MKIKKFIAPSIKQALTDIKKELGDNAVILNSKKVKHGNLLSKEMFEITAAIDELDHPKYKEIRPTTVRHENAYSAPESTDWRAIEKVTKMTADMDEIKTALQQMSEQIKYNLPNLPKTLKDTFLELSDRGINHTIVQELVQNLYRDLSMNDLDDNHRLQTFVKANIGNRFHFAPIGVPTSTEPYIIMLIGPTGTGKTTTLAKMATHNGIYNNRKIAFITTDTYRIAGIEQLRTFAKIAQCPLEIVYTVDDIQKAILRHQDKELILIDTPGRSYHSHSYLMELKELIDRAKPNEVHLVLAANLSTQTMKNMIDHFSALPFNRFLFTKFDETACPSALLNVICEFNKAITFITTGQDVPDDIKCITPQEIANLIVE
jgi:flagellar biosynthesis protein FlhF